ncbi:hypothetical protein Rleg4DRAFT_2306 [Rhizobium leguminosarum bv. trifolii WSM2297]|uniref:Bacterial HORMA domain-containing protein n=1 Tax=Rhizobium leguminosarum bv. trifolii WSM2297 TaxID=754762 RepID=J0CM71_RHILT|nr:hypothetical protein [Rhizobium leguminosarum]EJC80670.1 hypothetical protein Rleg4DRAFT_2306 [Rhizobium leguminosarum bv. trifolii WSM2297]
MSVTRTASATGSYTTTDINIVVRQFTTDLKMIASSTRAMTETAAADYGADVELLASKGYLKAVDVTQMFGGREIRAVKYHVDENTGTLKSARPGGVRWDELSGSSIRIIMSHTDSFSSAVLESLRGRLNISWGFTSVDTSHSSLTSSGRRDYASNGWGMRREDWS